MPKRSLTPDPQIVQYEDGTFYVRVGDRERSLKTKDFKKACKLKQVVLAKLDLLGALSGRLKIEDIWEDYVRFRRGTFEGDVKDSNDDGSARRRRRTISKNTFKEIESVWRNQLKSFWAPVRFENIDEEKWLEYVEISRAIDLANPRKVLSGCLTWCKAKKYIKYLPDMPIPSVERRERKVLKPFEIRKLFQHAKGSLLLFISAYLFMGMRRKEIMTLRWDCIQLDEQYLFLNKSITKIRRGRPLPINPFVLELLRRRLAEQQKTGIKTPFVFPHRDNLEKHADLGGLKTAWNRVIALCNFEAGYITPHDLRATYEAYAHKAKDFTDTQREKFAGAAIDVQKKTYVRFDAEDVRGLESVVQVEGLEAILNQKLTGRGRGERKQGNLH